MLNVLDSIGYANEKLHTGMINYLCDLFNCGSKEPIRSFFNELDESIFFEDDITLEVEKESAYLDIVIKKVRPDNAKEYYIGIEMKVDSHEHDGQTLKYYKALTKYHPDMEHFFYMTLGMGEYYLSPDCKEFTWIKLAKCISAVNNISTEDINIYAWRYMLERERVFRAYCQNNDYNGLLEFPVVNKTRKAMWCMHGWNMSFLGELKIEVESGLSQKYLSERELAVYTYGSKPDTIFNLLVDDCNKDGSFIEINGNGKLNLKLITKLKGGNRVDIKKILTKYCFESVSSGVYLVSEIASDRTDNITSSTKTIKQYDIGIEVINGIFQYKVGETRSSVADKLLRIAIFFAVENI